MVSRPPLRKENWPAGAPCQPSRRRKPGAPRAKRAEKEAGAPIGFGPEMEEPRRIAGHRRKHSDRAGATAEKRVKLGKSRDREPEESASVVGARFVGMDADERSGAGPSRRARKGHGPGKCGPSWRNSAEVRARAPTKRRNAWWMKRFSRFATATDRLPWPRRNGKFGPSSIPIFSSAFPEIRTSGTSNISTASRSSMQPPSSKY